MDKIIVEKESDLVCENCIYGSFKEAPCSEIGSCRRNNGAWPKVEVWDFCGEGRWKIRVPNALANHIYHLGLGWAIEEICSNEANNANK